MKNIIISKKNTISVYQFMDMCGLECKEKNNVNISHKTMLKKLELRNSLFPKQVIVPKSVSFDKIKREDILRGSVLLVLDDMDKVIAYMNPNRENLKVLLNELQSVKSRKRAMKERKLYLQKEGYVELPNGEIVSKDILEENQEKVTDNRTVKLINKYGYKMRGAL